MAVSNTTRISLDYLSLKCQHSHIKSKARITVIFEQIKSGDFLCPDPLGKYPTNGLTIVILDLSEWKQYGYVHYVVIV